MQNAIETLREEVEERLSKLEAKTLAAFAAGISGTSGKPHPANVKRTIEELPATPEQKQLAKQFVDELLPITSGNRA